MTVIKGFFFDLDGTLVNTYEADFLAYRDAILEVTGITITAEDFYATNGQEMRQKLITLAPGLDSDDQAKIAAAKKAHYPTYVNRTLANEDLIHFLQSSTQNQVIGLITTAKKQNAETVLSHHGIKDVFDFCIFGDDVVESKPNPEGYLLALQKADLMPSEVIAFEDSESGIKAAEAAGISVIHVERFK